MMWSLLLVLFPMAQCNGSIRPNQRRVAALIAPNISPRRGRLTPILFAASSHPQPKHRQQRARVAFVASDDPSGYGRTSPEPDPPWSTVASQLARRLPNFGGTVVGGTGDGDGDCGDGDGDDVISAVAIRSGELHPRDLEGCDCVVALGVTSAEDDARLAAALASCGDADDDSAGPSAGGVKALLADPTCSEATRDRRFAGSYSRASSSYQDVVAALAPWSSVACGRRLLDKTDVLLARKSSEDYIFAVLFALNSLAVPLDVVKSDINPSWEKGVVRNLNEFRKMITCCRPQIVAALTDPRTKMAIDLLNAVDLRDQVGSYRVIVSNETPELEEFTLCILQQNDCFGCDAPILDRPRVPILRRWRDEPLTDDAARRIMVGHLDHPAADDRCSRREPWSWKIVLGANPAYDAFPMQHQIFYPPEGTGSKRSLWYDPVFCVETLDGDLVWCKRHYRCTPRRHWSADLPGDDDDDGTTTMTTKTTETTDSRAPTPGAWTLSTLDNGMVSEERWTTVDAADDLSWCVLHYSGAARRAGQSYVGALLCSPDGMWPEGCKEGEGLERIRAAFRKCDLELWELFGSSTERSYMWSKKFADWARVNPPPLDRIGDISITAWRKREREKELAAKRSS